MQNCFVEILTLDMSLPNPSNNNIAIFYYEKIISQLGSGKHQTNLGLKKLQIKYLEYVPTI